MTTDAFFQPDNWAQRKLRAISASTLPSDKEYQFLTSCVASTAELIDAMTELGEEVTPAEFFAACEVMPFCDEMGYDEDFPLESDWLISYHRSTYDGQPCYYLCHSSIEYIWVKQ